MTDYDQIFTNSKFIKAVAYISISLVFALIFSGTAWLIVTIWAETVSAVRNCHG